MNQQEISRRLNRFEREIRSTSEGIGRYLERNPHTDIQRVAENQMKDMVGRFIDREIENAKSTTHDWIFDKVYVEPESKKSIRVYPRKNSLGKNRYFIYDFVETPIAGQVSTFGRERVREMEISDREISSKITNMKGLFAQMMKVTVDKTEQQNIWKAYDTIDEKKIILVMASIAAAPILIAEALPALAASELLATELGYLASSGPAWQSYVGSSLTVSGVMETSLYDGAVNGITNLGGQIISNDFKIDSNINLSQTAFATFTKGLLSNLGESLFEFKYSEVNGFTMETTTAPVFYSTFFSNVAGGEVSTGFGNLTKPVNAFTPVFRSSFDIIGGTGIEAGENVFGQNIEEGLNDYNID